MHRLENANVSTGKAEQAARRTEKLARRNPERLQRQLDDLRAAQESGHVLNSREKTMLEELERDITAVRKARDSLGDKAPQLGSGPSRGGRESQRDGRDDSRRGRGGGTLGKRRRDDEQQWRHHEDHTDSSTSESVKNIPMPRDTPPPIPPEYLRPRNHNQQLNPNLIPLPVDGPRTPHPLPTKPETAIKVQAQTVYEAKPVVRDLRKEAVTAFVPSVVRHKMESTKGQGRLLEPEEVEKLEKEGYVGRTSAGYSAGDPGKLAGKETVSTVDAAKAETLEEEEKRFERELKSVIIEDVEDDDV